MPRETQRLHGTLVDILRHCTLPPAKMQGAHLFVLSDGKVVMFCLPYCLVLHTQQSLHPQVHCSTITSQRQFLSPQAFIVPHAVATKKQTRESVLRSQIGSKMESQTVSFLTPVVTPFMTPFVTMQLWMTLRSQLRVAPKENVRNYVQSQNATDVKVKYL